MWWYSISFSFQISLPHLGSGWQTWYYTYSSIHSYQSQGGKWLSITGKASPRVTSPSLHCLSTFLALGSTRGGSVRNFMYQSVSPLLHFWTSITSRTLGVKYIQPPWQFQVSNVFPPQALIPLVLFTFLAEYVTSWIWLLILVPPWWMEAPWLLTVLNILENIPHQCPFINNLIIDVLVGLVLKNLWWLYLTLWMLRDVCCGDKGSLPQSVRQWQGSTTQVYQQCWKEWAGWCTQMGVLNYATSAPKLAYFCLIYLGLDWLGTQLILTIQLYLPFWNCTIFIKLQIILSYQN